MPLRLRVRSPLPRKVQPCSSTSKRFSSPPRMTAKRRKSRGSLPFARGRAEAKVRAAKRGEQGMAKRKAAPKVDQGQSQAPAAAPEDSVYIGKSVKPEFIYLRLANRHGLITGATGTGKT